MRNKLPLFTAALCLCGLLASCGAPAELPDSETLFSRPFRMTASCVAGETASSFEFEYLSADSGSLTFIEPAAVCGMALTREGAVVREDFLGITSEREFSSLPRSNPLAALFSLAAATRLDGAAASASTSGHSYELPDGSSLLAVSGVPRVIELASAGLTITVTSFEYLDESN